ncbi:MAG: hypothetical protein HZA89_02375 [Verrucomicrobia bacterium]|nr:hypothetical protein [Verrucomicrobiota bacterium]
MNDRRHVLSFGFLRPLALVVALFFIAGGPNGRAQNRPVVAPVAKVSGSSAGGKTNTPAASSANRPNASAAKVSQPPAVQRSQAVIRRASAPSASQALESVEGQSFRGYTIPRVNAAPTRIGGRSVGGITAVTVRVRMSDGQRVVRDTIVGGGARLP